MLDTPTLETKSTDPDVIDLARAFAEFKATNDERLAKADVVTTDKLARIERTMDEFALKQARPAIGGAAPMSTQGLAHKSAFDAYVRQGACRPDPAWTYQAALERETL